MRHGSSGARHDFGHFTQHMRLTAQITAAGASTAAAPNLAGTLATYQKRSTFFCKSNGFVGDDFQPQLCAFRSPEVHDDLVERLTTLTHEAMQDLLTRPLPFQTDYKVVLCLPKLHANEGTNGLHDATRIAQITNAILDPLIRHGCTQPTEISILPEGGPAFIQALINSTSQAEQSVLVLAVDSYASRTRLNRLMGQKLLFSSTNPWGLIPGEAAVALVCQWRAPNDHALSIQGPALTVEPHGEMMGRDTFSSGMTEAVQETLRSVGEQTVNAIITDCNNSRYRASEIAYAMHRMPATSGALYVDPHHFPLKCGDIGAAAVPLALLCALPLDGIALLTTGERWEGWRGCVAVIKPATFVQSSYTHLTSH